VSTFQHEERALLSESGWIFERPVSGFAQTPRNQHLSARPADLFIGCRAAGLRDIALIPNRTPKASRVSSCRNTCAF